eukprot:s408_g12.t1
MSKMQARKSPLISEMLNMSQWAFDFAPKLVTHGLAMQSIIVTDGGTDSAAEVLKTGTKFGYAHDLLELGEELGSGAAAKVYVCRRLSTGEELAVKVINLGKLRLMGDFEGHLTDPISNFVA